MEEKKLSQADDVDPLTVCEKQNRNRQEANKYEMLPLYQNNDWKPVLNAFCSVCALPSPIWNPTSPW